MGLAELESQVPPNTLWLCQLIPCNRQEACTAVSSKLELHLPPAAPGPLPRDLSCQGIG